MNSLARFFLLLVLVNLSGCAFLVPFLQHPSSNERSIYPSLKTFEIEDAVIYYRDLSDPCDDRTVAWNDLNEVKQIRKASLNLSQIACDKAAKTTQVVTTTQFEVQQQISIPFESRQAELSDSTKTKSFEPVNGLVSQNTQFHIYGAAGRVGVRSEKLGLARASYVRDRLISMGVQHERIRVMPYDPKIPGLQALVEVLRPVTL